MEFRVLGPLEILDEDRPIAVSRRKCQALLALLLSRAPHPLSTDAIAEALWPDALPEPARNSVRVHATYLRKALGAGAALIPRTAGGYRITIARAQLDVSRFEDCIESARSIAAAGDAAQAAVEFGTALSEWRREPYLDFPDVDLLRDERERLLILRLDALEGYATVLLDDDRADEAARLLLPVVDDHLHHETLAARLMLALHRTGRQHEALAVFARVREALTESGMPPTPQLQELANAIVMHDAALDTSNESGAVSRRSRRVVPPRRRAEFIGRDRELRDLHACWSGAMQGTPKLAYVAGSGGLGKTTLVRRFADQVRAEGGIVFMGECDPDPSENYQPFPDLIRSVLAVDAPTDSSPTMLGELTRLGPDLAHQLPAVSVPAGPGAGRQRLFTAVAEILAAPTHPRVLILEDLHWARPDAVLLLRHLVRQARGQVLVLATFRADEVRPVGLYGPVEASGRITRPDLRLDLAPMGHHEVRALIDAVAPNERREEWIGRLDALVSVTLGNPLRVREVLRQLELEPDVPVSEIAPEDVRGLVDRRLRALDPQTRTVVQTASVFGREFTLRQIGAAAKLPDEAVLDALEASMDQGLVVEGTHVDDFAFAHPLFRNAIYYSLVRSRRARMHVRCGDALRMAETTPTNTGPLDAARHYLAARPVSDADLTARCTREAGDDATRRYAHDEAVEWYRNAVDCATAAAWPDVAVARIRLSLGMESALSGDLDTARSEYFLIADIARAARDISLMTDVVAAATPRESILDDDLAQQLTGLIDEVLDALDPHDPIRVRLLHGAALARVYLDPTSLPAIAAESTRLAHGSDDPLIVHSSLVTQYLAADADNNAARLVYSRAIRDHTIDHHLVTEIGGASRRYIAELLISGGLTEFDAELAAMANMARVTSIPDDLYWAAAFGATRGLMRECTSTTEELIRGAGLLGRQLQVESSDGVLMLQMFALRFQQDRIREVTKGLAAPDASSPQVFAGTSLLALALMDADSGAARSIIDRVVDDGRIRLPVDNFRTAAIALFAGVAARCGTVAQRRVIRRALEPHADQFCVFGAGGAVFGTNHHWLARLDVADGDPTSAADHLQAAMVMCQDAGALHWVEVAQRELRHITLGLDDVEPESG